jgi:hypothetical protein
MLPHDWGGVYGRGVDNFSLNLPAALGALIWLGGGGMWVMRYS